MDFLESFRWAEKMEHVPVGRGCSGQRNTSRGSFPHSSPILTHPLSESPPQAVKDVLWSQRGLNSLPGSCCERISSSSWLQFLLRDCWLPRLWDSCALNGINCVKNPRPSPIQFTEHNTCSLSFPPSLTFMSCVIAFSVLQLVQQTCSYHLKLEAPWR